MRCILYNAPFKASRSRAAISARSAPARISGVMAVKAMLKRESPPIGSRKFGCPDELVLRAAHLHDLQTLVRSAVGVGEIVAVRDSPRDTCALREPQRQRIELPRILARQRVAAIAIFADGIERLSRREIAFRARADLCGGDRQRAHV